MKRVFAMCSRCGEPFQPTARGIVNRRHALLGLAGGCVTTASNAFPLSAMAASSREVVRAPYGAGFCSLGLFLVHAERLADEDKVELELVTTPTFADHITMVGSGVIDMSVTPYTSVIALKNNGANIRIVGGGGIEGCGLVARPGIDRPEDLRGTTLGTFQMDSLEILAFDWLRANKVPIEDIEVRYMGSVPEAVEAFKAGALDWITSIEPYVTSLLHEVPGARLLSDGRDIYGPGYADCVLTAQAELVEKRPEAVKAVIKALMRAQYSCETDLDSVLAEMVGPYYKTTLADAKLAAAKQPVQVDIRNQEDFILARADSLVQMGYISTRPDRDLIDWHLLEETIAANGPLWQNLERRTVHS